MKQTSEFGKGCTYCIGLFLMHKEKYYELKKIYKDHNLEILYPQSWFNNSSDHLYELQIPKQFPVKLKKRLKQFQNKVLDLGHGLGVLSNNVTEKDVLWSLNEAKDLLMEIDKQLNVKVIKGDFE